MKIFSLAQNTFFFKQTILNIRCQREQRKRKNLTKTFVILKVFSFLFFRNKIQVIQYYFFNLFNDLNLFNSRNFASNIKKYNVVNTVDRY